VLAGLAYGQERVNYLAVNGTLVGAAGPYYFIAQGDRRDAFAKARPLANAMRLRVTMDVEAKSLRFSDGTTTAVFETTGSVARGLAMRTGALTVNGRPVSSPMAIVVGGVAYVAITPLVAAFGGVSPWNAVNHVITIETDDHVPHRPSTPRTGARPADTGGTGAPLAKISRSLPAGGPTLAHATSGQQVVVLDPGHGGMDPGASSRWVVEKAVVLKVALKVARILRGHHVKVIMTRDNDTFITLAKRSSFETPRRNLFVSIHANAAPDASAHGIETWVFGKPLKSSYIDLAIRENGTGAQGRALTAQARQLAAGLTGQILQQTQLSLSLTLARDVQDQLVAVTGAVDRGVRKNWFYVLRTARIPSILVELGFVSNPVEGRELATASYQQRLADGLAAGILKFLNGDAILAHR